MFEIKVIALLCLRASLCNKWQIYVFIVAVCTSVVKSHADVDLCPGKILVAVAGAAKRLGFEVLFASVTHRKAAFWELKIT
eukprot:12330939-Ditylum_brightwellii.AAC.1